MNKNMKEKNYPDYKQHMVMFNKPYPLIYNQEMMQPAIHIGTLNIVDFTGRVEVNAYPVILPLLLDDMDGESNPFGVVSPYSLYDDGNNDTSEWMNICLLQDTVNIEDLFPIMQNYCFVENTLIQKPSEIINALKKHGYRIKMPAGRNLNIYIESDDNGVTWHSAMPLNGEFADFTHFTNMWFLAAGGGCLPANIENMVWEAVFYDSLFLENNRRVYELPNYKFMKNPEFDGDIDYINKTFTELLNEKRKIHWELC